MKKFWGKENINTRMGLALIMTAVGVMGAFASLGKSDELLTGFGIMATVGFAWFRNIGDKKRYYQNAEEFEEENLNE